MRRALFVMTFAATVQLQLSGAPAVSEDAPVPAPILALADSLHVDAARDPARFVSELIRLIHTRVETKEAEIARTIRALGLRGAGPVSQAVLVPVPLSAEVWSRAVFRRSVPLNQLVQTIVLDRTAALLCYALAGLDDETLAFLSEHPGILTSLAERDAPAFSAFGASLRIHGNRIVTPGGDDAVALWESVVGESVDKPDRFVRALFAIDEGRLAYLYDRIGHLDEAHARFALGLWMASPAARRERFAALVVAVARSYGEWHLRDLPFSRPLNDFAFLMARLHVEPTGAPAGLSDRAFWAAVFGQGSLPDGETVPGRSGNPELVDAAFLTEATGSGGMFSRGDRLEAFSFGQRVFSDVDARSSRHALAALSVFSRHRMLFWELERMGVTAPAAYAAAVRQADQVMTGDPNRTFWTLAQLQGVLALVARMTMVGTLEAPAVERLVASISTVPVGDDRRFSGRIVSWVERELLPMLPADVGTAGGAGLGAVESRLINGVSGPVREAAPRIVWEGQAYRVDFSPGERHRLRTVREKQGGYSVDFAFELARVARQLSENAATVEDIGRATTSLTGMVERLPSELRLRQGESALMAPGVQSPRPARETVERAIDELSKASRGRDLKRASRLAPSLMDAADTAFGQALLSFVYAMNVGDPQGTALLGSNIALRHDFGLALNDSEARLRRAWDVPRQDVLPGVPWHVTGSLLGLDIALAPMRLRRVDLNRIADAPRLQAHEREGFAVGAVLMNPRLLRDADRDAIVAAIAKGREAVAAIRSPQDLAAAATRIELDGWRTRALAWTLRNRPADVPSMFSLRELLALGGGAAGADLDAWGASALYSRGCACTELAPPGNWALLAGRPQIPMMSAFVADLNLRVAIGLSELRLPASLARPVVQAAVQDFNFEAEPSDAGDWWALVRSAQALSQGRIEDYLADVAAINGPLVPIDDLEAVSQP